LHKKFLKAKGRRRWGILLLLLPIMYVAFPRSDYHALSDSPWCLRSFVGLSLTYFPPSLTFIMGSPVFSM